ncbi:hypothetical protein J1N35_029174 [Gossypium stocksii]|uniref:Uncharacterized protein n=1 Tax=Gossypium stocksii TaxID=47602 RepID=A0A9D3UXE1_9ROSI|nr:hypothetical protein J1N35_029174 [Gossypium stocksii]
MPQGIKEYIFSFASSSSTKRPSLKELIPSLQVTLVEIKVITLGLLDSMENEEIKKKEFENSFHSTQEALEEVHELYKKLEEDNSKMVKHFVTCQVAGGPFDTRKVNLNALSHFIDAQLGFDIRFPLEPAWEEFVEEWKNSSKLFVADEPIAFSVAPVTNSKKGKSEDTREDVDELNANV